MDKSQLSFQSMSARKMKQVLIRDNTVESNSPKNRKILYKMLNNEKISFHTNVIGYTGGTHSLCLWTKHGVGYDLRRIAMWIKGKRILKEDLKNACEQYNGKEKFEDIESAFDEEKTHNEIKQIFKNAWGEVTDSFNTKSNMIGKYGPFDSCPLHKTIVKITLGKKLNSKGNVDENQYDFDMEICI